MLISDLEFFLIEVPFSRIGFPLCSVLVRLTTYQGYEGWGEILLKWKPEELVQRRDRLLPVLSGRNVFDIEDLIRLEELRDPTLCLGIETACWDLIGKLSKQPICHFFGGEYRHRIPLVVRLYGQTPDELASTSFELVNRGYHLQVLPLTGKIEEDRMLVETLIETVGNRIELRIDGEGHYSREEALELCNHWKKLGLGLFIDPIASENVTDYLSFQRETNIPVGVSRVLYRPSDLLPLIRSTTSLFPILDLSRVGSLQQTRKCAAIAEAAGLRVALTSPPSLGLVSAATLQLSAALPAISNGNEVIVFRPQNDILKDRETFDISDGLITLLHGAGIGLEFDRAKLDRFLIS